MKKFLPLLLALLLMTAFLAACDNGAGSSAEQTDPSADSSTDPSTDQPIDITQAGSGDVVDGKLILIKDGETVFDVIYPNGAGANNDMIEALTALKAAIRDCGVTSYNQMVDVDNEPAEYEILVGATNRPESQIFKEDGSMADLYIRVVGKKVIVGGYTNNATAQAVYQFIDKYLVVEDGIVSIPADTDETLGLDMNTCQATGMTYSGMANTVYNAFISRYFPQPRSSYVDGANWWDGAEILETFIDAYEATGDETAKSYMLKFARSFVSRQGRDWSYNEFNDDIMWACIAFARIAILTDNSSYYDIAKSNFDKVYERALDSKLGGGLYWKTDNTTKNSCVNCPASIAACLLAKYTSDASESEAYWAKAKTLMNWEIKEMFERNSGKVYDAYPLTGKKSTWASTYNQGTFIGACTFLAEHYTEEADTYLLYASRAASYAMRSLTTNGILDNGEGDPKPDNRDLIGFKGILTRWLYRYAKATDNLEILSFLQQNAATAFQNRNAAGLIWTQWHLKTPDGAESDGNHLTFGMSTAVALMYNALPWWD